MENKDRSMYELSYPVPSLGDSAPAPVLIVALQGYADAGQAIEMASDYLRAALDHEPLATFNNDELIDFRSRRPRVSLADGVITGIDPLPLAIEVLSDTSGRPFLLLSGPEPDMRWGAFSAAVADLVEKFGIGETVCLYSAATMVPHTRPTIVTSHGTIRAVAPFQLMGHELPIQVPGAASLTIEHELVKRGLLAGGYTAYIPHYVAGDSYPEAARRLLQSVTEHTGLDLPMAALNKDTQRFAEKLAEKLTDSAEFGQMIDALEEKYDAEQARMLRAEDGLEVDDEASVPSAEELGQAAESFLAELESTPTHGDTDAHERPRPSADDDAGDLKDTDQADDDQPPRRTGWLRRWWGRDDNS